MKIVINNILCDNTPPKHWQRNTKLQVRDGEIIIYPETKPWEDKPDQGKKEQLERIRNVQKYSGRWTIGSQKRCMKAATLMFQGFRPRMMQNPENGRPFLFKGAFITLTIPASVGKITPKRGHELLLYPFLRWLTRTEKCSTYLWKSEFTKQGTLHYHLVIPKFIHYREIRKKWNECLKDAGLLEDHFLKFGNFQPPSTEIRNLKRARKTAKYLAKELGKDIDANVLTERKRICKLFTQGKITREQRNECLKTLDISKISTKGKLWDCSVNLTGSYFTVYLEPGVSKAIQLFVKNGMYKTVVREDYFEVIDLCGNDPPLTHDQLYEFENFCGSIRNFNPN